MEAWNSCSNFMAEPGDVTNTIQMSTVIVFHPGSRNLRLGRATDPEPHTVLHAIARKRILSNNRSAKSNAIHEHRDPMIPLLPDTAAKPPPEIESARQQLCNTLQSTVKSDGSLRYSTPSQQIATYNRRSVPDPVPDSELKNVQNPLSWFGLFQKDTIAGDDVIKVSTMKEYNIHFPWRRGHLHLHSGIGGSMSSVLNDLEDIWSWGVSEVLGISIKDLSDYQAVVVIPVMFDRLHAKELTDLALNRLGFGSAFLLHDHVAATFGAGLSCATVVDVGDQKISVSCVEDGISFPETRLELKYGGGDLTYAMGNLLLQSGIPFKTDLRCLWDIKFLSDLKEELCHLDLNRCGPEEHTVLWDKPGQSALRFTILVADELLVIPLSFFNPDLLRGSVPKKSISLYKQQAALHDDPFDSKFIVETAKRSLKEADTGEAEEEDMEESKSLDDSVESRKFDAEQLLGIEQVIIQSIESHDMADDLKRRLYATILVVGAGFKFKGLGSWLQTKIIATTPRQYQSEPQEIIIRAKDKDPATTVWRGAALLSGLETAIELWITKDEWNTHGSRILREKSLCVF